MGAVGLGGFGAEEQATRTFLFTDIEGSTRRWQADPVAMPALLAAHDETLRSAVEGRRGRVFKHTGDGLCAVFASVGDAVSAAIEAQRGLELPVRMAIHTGEAIERDGDFFGVTLGRCARLDTSAVRKTDLEDSISSPVDVALDTDAARGIELLIATPSAAARARLPLRRWRAYLDLTSAERRQSDMRAARVCVALPDHPEVGSSSGTRLYLV
jgi:class 3 adenylate cyclase